MEQTKALNALEPFVALTKSASSPRAAVDLITRATSAPNTFVFTELFVASQIQSLRSSPEYAAHLQLLSIFCYGTYDTYTQTTDQLPPLNHAQALKLRQLSLLTLAEDPRNLTYANLITLLGLANARALENLVISAIYAGLVSGTLDPYNQRVCITSCAPLRDVSPQSIPSMITTLHEWSARCTSTMSSLEKQIATIKAEAQRRHKEEQDWQRYVETLITNETTKEKAKGGRGGDHRKGLSGGGDEEMDVDELSEDGVQISMESSRAAKKRGFGTS